MIETVPTIKLVRFDQMATLVSDRIDDPAESGVERYVGLEHLDSDSLRIRRWGSVTDVEATKLRFQSGDIIFGKRRVYQRKLAVADFEGICSAHAMVLRANSEVILAEFLPYFMQSDYFMERALQISVGSLSPTINWRTLAAQEFALPSLEVQRQMAKVLCAWQQADDALRQAVKTSELLLQSMLGSLLTGEQQSFQPTVPLQEVAVVERGRFSHRPRNLPEFYGGPYPFAQTGDVAAARGYQFKASQTLSDAGLLYSRSFPPDTVLVTIAAVIGATAITSEDTWCPDSVVGIVPRNPGDAPFIDYAMRFLRPYLENQVATQTAQKNINLAVLRPLEIPWPDSAARRAIVLRLSKFEESMEQLNARQRALQGIQGAILAPQGATGR